MSTGRIVLNEFTVDAPPVERVYDLFPAPGMKSGGSVKVRVQVTCQNAGGVAPPKGLVEPE
jgi:hypothetical protein